MILHRIDGLSDIAHPHCDAVAIGDDQRFVVDSFQQLVVGADLPHPDAFREMSFGNIRVGAGKRGRVPIRS